MLVQKITGNTVRRGTRGLASALLSRSEKDWLAKTANDLRKEAKARGLSQNGSKVQIARRLMKAEQQALQSIPTQASPAAVAPTPSAPSSSPSTSSRQFTSSAKYNVAAEPTNSSKFTPKRPYILNLEMPEAREPVEEGPTIPYLPDYFQSHHTQSASPLQEPTSLNEPRVLTVASAATHSGGGPSHGTWGAATDPHLAEVHGADKAVELSGAGASASSAILASVSRTAKSATGQKESGIVGDLLEDFGLAGFTLKPPKAEAAVSPVKATVKEAVQGVRSAVSHAINQPSAEVVAEEYASKGPTTDKLKPEEKQGLYALAGIVSAGYLLSKIFV